MKTWIEHLASLIIRLFESSNTQAVAQAAEGAAIQTAAQDPKVQASLALLQAAKNVQAAYADPAPAPATGEPLPSGVALPPAA